MLQDVLFPIPTDCGLPVRKSSIQLQSGVSMKWQQHWDQRIWEIQLHAIQIEWVLQEIGAEIEKRRFFLVPETEEHGLVNYRKYTSERKGYDGGNGKISVRVNRAGQLS